MSEDSNSESGNNESANSDLPDYDDRMLRRLEEDLRHTHTETLQTFTDLSGAAGRLLGFAGSTLAVITGAAALVNDLNSVITIWNILGISFIILSVLITLIGHRSRQVTTGLSRNELKRALALEEQDTEESDEKDFIQYAPSGHSPLNESQYLVWINRNYMRWISDAIEENASKSRELFFARLSYSLGVLFLIVGTILPLLNLY